MFLKTAVQIQEHIFRSRNNKGATMLEYAIFIGIIVAGAIFTIIGSTGAWFREYIGGVSSTLFSQ